jgi:hypothetical protein
VEEIMENRKIAETPRFVYIIPGGGGSSPDLIPIELFERERNLDGAVLYEMKPVNSPPPDYAQSPRGRLVFEQFKYWYDEAMRYYIINKEAAEGK